MERIYIKDLHDHIGSEVTIKGWVDVRRDHGKLIFIDLRDRTGVVQTVALPNHEDAHKIADTVRSEWVKIPVAACSEGCDDSRTGGLLRRRRRRRAARGNLAQPVLEGATSQDRWIAQACKWGGRRPYPVSGGEP